MGTSYSRAASAVPHTGTVSTRHQRAYDTATASRTNIALYHTDTKSGVAFVDYTPRRIMLNEHKSTHWTALPTSMPVYVALRDKDVGGVCEASHWRTERGAMFYSVRKLHPIDPTTDRARVHFYEVPRTVRGQSIITKMAVAVAEYWPARDQVLMFTSKGTKYYMSLKTLRRTDESKFITALHALARDCPSLSLNLAFRRVSAPPEVHMYADYDDAGRRTDAHETLAPADESNADFHELHPNQPEDDDDDDDDASGAVVAVTSLLGAPIAAPVQRRDPPRRYYSTVMS